MSTTTRPSWLRLAAMGLTAAIVLAGCGGSDDDADPAEGEAADDGTAAEDGTEPVTLRMAHPFGQEPTIDHFRSTVDSLSDGTLQVQVGEVAGGPDEEQRIVQAVAAGDFDLGWIGTRALAELGVTSFDALTAPFLINSYPLLHAVLTSDIPARMLDDLDSLDVSGLAVIGGGLRKPFAVDAPLLRPDDFAGITFRTFQSAGHGAAITALGAIHSDAMQAVDVALADGTIHAQENTLNWYQALDANLTPHITLNVTLWPQTMVLVANPRVVADLTDTQASALWESAADTATRSVELSDVDAEKVDVICEWGGRFAEASNADLDALRQAVQPVYDGLVENSDTAAFIAEIETLKDSVVAEPLTIPDGCTGDAPGVVALGDDDPSVLDGTYQLEWTVEELLAAGVPAEAIDEFDMAGFFNWTFNDGELIEQWRDDATAEPNTECFETYGVTGDEVTIQRATPCVPWHWQASWELDDDTLRFSDPLLDGEPSPILDTWLTSKPWTKID